jgi:3-methyladenine DNA glycosylase AlkD
MPSLSRIRRDLRALASPQRAAVVQRYFKTGPGEYGEGDRFLGITVPALRRVASSSRDLSLAAIDELLRSPWHEERLLALLILVRQYARETPAGRDAIFRLYMRRTAHISNWDLVDLSAGIVGAHLQARGRSRLRRLARSSSVWERRIAIVATYTYIKRGEFDETLRIAAELLDDPHDLIHKAVGWMLREVGKRDRRVEEAFLRTHAARMPRTMLRYAIERFPAGQRRRWLAARSAGGGARAG